MHRLILFASLFAFVGRASVSTASLFAAPPLASELQGEHEDPNAKFGKGTAYKLAGDAEFGWRTGTIDGDVDVGAHRFVMETGGGNHTVFRGAIRGTGSFEWRGGGVPQVAPSTLGGDRPNTMSGIFALSKGILDLDKPAGVDAIAGDLVIGGKGDAVVRLKKPHQIRDAAHITFAKPGLCGLDLSGHDERFASLGLETHATIAMGAMGAMGEGATTLAIGASGARTWDLTRTLTIQGYKPGRDRLSFGSSGDGLTAAQLARIGFASPAGLAEGLYTARLAADGQLTPGTPVQAIAPPFDVSPAAVAERAKLYELSGLSRLAAADSPLRDGMTLVFFGDSITWQNGYIAAIERAVKNAEGADAVGRRSVKFVNRGVNGGGVLQLRDGAKEGGYPGSKPQEPFARLIASDRADVAVVFIGINDVWWRKTTPEDFDKGLRDLASSAAAQKTRLVLATLTVRGELPDGKNADDPKIEQYADLTRRAARDTGATLVDLRAAYVAALRNRNAQLRVDGTLYSRPSGVLTYDGVHPNAQGVTLLSELIADGIARALSER